MSELKTVLVRNGYLLPVDPTESIEALYARVLKAADAGDSEAAAALNDCPLIPMLLHVRDTTGVMVALYKNRIHLAHGHFPSSFKGSPRRRLQELAEQGNYGASRVLAYIAEQRITNPDSSVIEL